MLLKSQVLLFQFYKHFVNLPSPSNINYFWNFGSLLGMCLFSQILTGFFLSMHFCSDTSLAFNSMSHIIRDTNLGWMMRSLHANGASFFFILIYIHISRGMYFSSFHFKNTWFSGTLILLLLMATAFLGYVLPWGQMSFWGATVITNLLSAIPYIGNNLTFWIWGGFSVSNATLTRFFSLHFILPFILLILVMTHILFLHETGSNNPIGTPLNIDKINFHPFFTWKDLLGLLFLIWFFLFLCLTSPNFFLDPENFIQANPLVTPPHIQPEWYFLFAYAILRSIPNKLGGVIGLLLSILILLSLPFSVKNKFNFPSSYITNKIFYWIFINTFILLTYFGACPVEAPFVMLSQFFTCVYFSYFILKPISSLNFMSLF
uniref:Cytochrome b n=1 Tax=Hypoaspis linteyini TaxID=2695865 RepID=A0A6B9WH91_9ACAR|nr:cytochrome b [Hypoaspis linteyini]QHQ98584.1 cytochrome b [Hypoaspis linteyini]